MREPVRALVAIGLIGGLLTLPPPSATAVAPAAPAATAAATVGPVSVGLSGTVTLITGDRVEVAPGAPPRVLPAAGRGLMRFRITTDAGRVRVVPLDAVGLLASGRLDPRLFDVTTLLESGYDDARSPHLPLIVQQAPGRARASLAGTSAWRELPGIAGFSVRESKRNSAAFWKSLRGGAGGRSLAPGVAKVWLNGIRRTSLDRSVPQIGVPAAWQEGFTGRGVTVAVLDSGIDAQHPDLAGRIAVAKNFVGGPDGDQVGHGTHVASTLTGTGAASGGAYRGAAPDVRLLDAKVCSADDGCPEDAILAGMEWAAAEQRAAVVSMSLGGPDAPGDDPLEQAVNTLSARHGTLFVIAAGNNGELGTGTIDSPGSAASALTVGAVDDDDVRAPFSGRGPTAGNYLLKPDVTAPGVEIVAAKASGTGPVGESYVAASGTSMATPHVAGAAAILLQQHPDWTGAQVKAALMAAAKPMPGASGFDQGAGRVDVARAIKQQVVASPTSAGFGLATWPHDDDPVQTKTITYRNSGSSAVTLDLDLRVPDMPAGLFGISPSRIVVPAGGTADATLTVDTKPATVPIGMFSGQLVATGEGGASDGLTVSTPIGVEKEAERYDVQVTTIGRDGKAPREHIAFFDRLGPCDIACGDYIYEAGTGSGKLRLPPGEYTVGDFSTVTGTDWTVLMHSVLEVRKDGAVVLDARRAKPVQMSVPKATARLMELNVVVARDMHRGAAAVLTYVQPGDAENPVFIGELGDPAPVPGDVVSVAYGRFAEPGPAGDFANSAYEYNLADYAMGRAHNGVQLNPRQREFAAVKASYAADTDEARVAATSHWARPAGVTLDYAVPPTGARELTARLPFQRTEFYLAKGLEWSSGLVTFSEPDRIVGTWLFSSERSTYQPGRTYLEDWNKGCSGRV